MADTFTPPLGFNLWYRLNPSLTPLVAIQVWNNLPSFLTSSWAVAEQQTKQEGAQEVRRQLLESHHLN